MKSNKIRHNLPISTEESMKENGKNRKTKKIGEKQAKIILVIVIIFYFTYL